MTQDAEKAEASAVLPAGAVTAARNAGMEFGMNGTQRKLYGDIAEAGARAALQSSSSADADLRAERDIDHDPDTSWQSVPVHPTPRMLAGARNGLRRLIESVSPEERTRRWGEPVSGRGYQVPADEKHTARWHGMLLNAPKPSTSLSDRLKDRERKLAAAEAERDALRDRVKVLEEALSVAEAGLADIGDADREPGDDLAWCERRAAAVLPPVRAALNHGKGEDARAVLNQNREVTMMAGNTRAARQHRILQAVSQEPCLPLTLTDILDEDVTFLRCAGLVKTYWGMGGTHWTITDEGHAALARAASTKDQGGEHGK